MWSITCRPCPRSSSPAMPLCRHAPCPLQDQQPPPPPPPPPQDQQQEQEEDEQEEQDEKDEEQEQQADKVGARGEQRQGERQAGKQESSARLLVPHRPMVRPGGRAAPGAAAGR